MSGGGPMKRADVLKLVEEATDELIPVIGKAIAGLLNGIPPSEVLSVAERTLLADAADKRLDAALEGKP